MDAPYLGAMTNPSVGSSDPFTLSQQLADTVDALSPSLVTVLAGRRRLSGVAWSDDLVVTTLHPLRRGHGGPRRGRWGRWGHRRGGHGACDSGRHAARHGSDPDHHPDPSCDRDHDHDPGHTGRTVTVQRGDGVAVEARVVGHDRSTDLLLLQVPGGGLSPAPWVDGAAVRVGHLALVLGRPGASVRAALGMVSGLGGAFRTPLGGQLDRLIHVDATLPPGCVGGVLADLSGGVLGVNTDGLVQGGTTIPTATVRRVVGQLLAHGSVQRGYLGVGVQAAALPPEAAAVAGQPRGLVVVAVESDSPAAAARLTVGDVLLTVDGAPLEHLDQLILALQDLRPAPTMVRVLRGGAVVEVAVELSARPSG